MKSDFTRGQPRICWVKSCARLISNEVLTCGMFLQAGINKSSRRCPRQRRKERRNKAHSVALCVFINTRVCLKGPKNGFSTGTVSSRPGSCPLVRFCFLATAPGAQRLSGDALKHNTPNEMWLAPPYCSIYTGWDDIEEEMHQKKKKVLTCCLMRSGCSPSPGRRLCNFHAGVWEWMGNLTPPRQPNFTPLPASPTLPPKAKRNSG